MSEEQEDVLTTESLRKIKKLLEREPPVQSFDFQFENKKLIDKTPEERQEESLRLIKKWERR